MLFKENLILSQAKGPTLANSKYIFTPEGLFWYSIKYCLHLLSARTTLYQVVSSLLKYWYKVFLTQVIGTPTSHTSTYRKCKPWIEYHLTAHTTKRELKPLWHITQDQLSKLFSHCSLYSGHSWKNTHPTVSVTVTPIWRNISQVRNILLNWYNSWKVNRLWKSWWVLNYLSLNLWD